MLDCANIAFLSRGGRASLRVHARYGNRARAKTNLKTEEANGVLGKSLSVTLDRGVHNLNTDNDGQIILYEV